MKPQPKLIILLLLALFLSFTSLSLADPNDEFKAAMKSLKSGNLHIALAEFKSYIAAYQDAKNKPEAEYQISEIYRQLKEYDQAITNAESFIRSYPNNPFVEKSKLLIAFSLLYKNKFNEAAERYKNFIQDYPESKFLPEAYFFLGKSFDHNLHRETKPNTKLALESYSRIIAEYPTSTWAQLAFEAIGYSYYIRGMYSNAIEYYNRFIMLYPDSKYKDRILLMLAASYQENRQYSQSDKLFDNIIAETQNELIRNLAKAKRKFRFKFGQVEPLEKGRVFRKLGEITSSEVAEIIEVRLPSKLVIGWEAKPAYSPEFEKPLPDNIIAVEVNFRVIEASATWCYEENGRVVASGDVPYEIRWDKGPGPFTITVNPETGESNPAEVTAKATIIIKRPQKNYNGASDTSTFSFKQYVEDLLKQNK